MKLTKQRLPVFILAGAVLLTLCIVAFDRLRQPEYFFGLPIPLDNPSSLINGDEGIDGVFENQAGAFFHLDQLSGSKLNRAYRNKHVQRYRDRHGKCLPLQPQATPLKTEPP